MPTVPTIYLQPSPQGKRQFLTGDEPSWSCNGCRHETRLDSARKKGSPVINGKELYHEGHQVHKGEEKRLILQAFAVVPFAVSHRRAAGVRGTNGVSVVVENGFSVKNGRTEKSKEQGGIAAALLILTIEGIA